jgi:hypothetical protein
MNTLVAMFVSAVAALSGLLAFAHGSAVTQDQALPEVSLDTALGVAPLPALSTPVASPVILPTPSSLISPSPSPSPSPLPSPSETPAVSAVRLAFVDVPNSVVSGQTIPLRWRIEGPDGVSGDQMSLVIDYKQAAEDGDATSSASNHTSQSFGSFQVPATFSSKLTVRGAETTIHVSVQAMVSGQSISISKNIKLVAE